MRAALFSGFPRINAFTSKPMTIRTFFILCLSMGCINCFSQKGTYKTYGDKKGIVYDLCFSKGGSWLVVPEGTAVRVYDLKTDQVLYTLEGGHQQAILSLDLSPDSSMVVTGGRDHLVVLWDLKTQHVLKALPQQESIPCVKFSNDQQYIAMGSADGSVQVYNLHSETIDYNSGNSQAPITSVSFNKDNTLLAYAGGEKTITLISTSTWKLLSVLEGHKKWVREVVFSGDRKTLLSCDDAGKICTWEISDPAKPVLYNQFHQGYKWLLSVDLQADGKTFASGGLSGKVSIDLPPSNYQFQLHTVVHKVRFLPHTGANLLVAVATRGKGTILMNSRNMHFKTR
jgi:WD40 repeat protein